MDLGCWLLVLGWILASGLLGAYVTFFLVSHQVAIAATGESLAMLVGGSMLLGAVAIIWIWLPLRFLKYVGWEILPVRGKE